MVMRRAQLPRNCLARLDCQRAVSVRTRRLNAGEAAACDLGLIGRIADRYMHGSLLETSSCRKRALPSIDFTGRSGGAFVSWLVTQRSTCPAQNG